MTFKISHHLQVNVYFCCFYSTIESSNASNEQLHFRFYPDLHCLLCFQKATHLSYVAEIPFLSPCLHFFPVPLCKLLHLNYWPCCNVAFLQPLIQESHLVDFSHPLMNLGSIHSFIPSFTKHFPSAYYFLGILFPGKMLINNPVFAAWGTLFFTWKGE